MCALRPGPAHAGTQGRTQEGHPDAPLCIVRCCRRQAAGVCGGGVRRDPAHHWGPLSSWTQGDLVRQLTSPALSASALVPWSLHTGCSPGCPGLDHTLF